MVYDPMNKELEWLYAHTGLILAPEIETLGRRAIAGRTVVPGRRTPTARESGSAYLRTIE
jgi:hypothetical protein